MDTVKDCGCGPTRRCPQHDGSEHDSSYRPSSHDARLAMKAGREALAEKGRDPLMEYYGGDPYTPPKKPTQEESLDVANAFGPPKKAQEEKPSNPKDIIGSTKLAMSMVPFTALAHWASAHMEGNVKYGRFNWRAVGVRSSIYIDAAMRHLMKYTDGEDKDPDTRVHHLASVMACCAIIIDAEACGKLTDDRPPSAPTSELVDKTLREVSEHLKELHSDKDPYHYTIEDTRDE